MNERAIAIPDVGTAETTLYHVLARRLSDSADKPWVVGEERAFSYREVDRLANRLANGLARLGVGRGDTVLLMLDNSIDFIALWCALGKLGAIEVSINCGYKGQLLARVMKDSLARIVIAEETYLSRFAEIAPELSAITTIVARSASSGADAAPPLAHARMAPFSDILDTNDRYDAAPLSPWDHAAIMYTSGTTGPSKGVIVTHGHAYEYARGVIDMLEIEPRDVYYAPLPLFHIAGQWAVIYAAAIAGATAVLPDAFSVSRFWSTVRRHRATCSFLLGAMANLLYRQAPGTDDAANPLERVLVVPLIPEVEAFKARFGCRVSTTWGGTEMNCPTRSGFTLPNNKTCGRVDERLYEVRIVDEHDNETAAGVPGEAVVRPKLPWIVMAGYWNRPDWTAEAWRNLWLHTGDMLMRDEAGNFYFVDRTKDAIRRRGENISSMEVEQEINAHPDVLECAVIPVSSDETEQEVMAVVVPKPGHRMTPEALIDFLAPRMAYFMVPRYIELALELPKTPTGKIQKYGLRARGVTPATWDRVAAGIVLKR
ncbi:MAG TPA: AMP-binding protein [Alphaproteobacteria bacterium]|nr:AMP-binding protein [Alphaproteobacteria bacterium]